MVLTFGCFLSRVVFGICTLCCLALNSACSDLDLTILGISVLWFVVILVPFDSGS